MNISDLAANVDFFATVDFFDNLSYQIVIQDQKTQETRGVLGELVS